MSGRAARPRAEIPLWDGTPPGSEDWTQQERTFVWDPSADDVTVRNVVHPAITPFVPDDAGETAVIIAPGGAFHFLSMKKEGADLAEWLAARGFASFVLKYRLCPTPVDDADVLEAVATAFGQGLDASSESVKERAVADGYRAVELVREMGYERVAMVGFSAGARITAEMVLERRGPRAVDLAALIYLSSIASPVPPVGAPPVFVLAAADDMLGIDGSLDLHAAWRAAARPVELHVFQSGGHGFGMATHGLAVDRWPELLHRWLLANGPEVDVVDRRENG